VGGVWQNVPRPHPRGDGWVPPGELMVVASATTSTGGPLPPWGGVSVTPPVGAGGLYSPPGGVGVTASNSMGSPPSLFSGNLMVRIITMLNNNNVFPKKIAFCKTSFFVTRNHLRKSILT
jgi:hypothetical protein